jgi:hypothetical protein
MENVKRVLLKPYDNVMFCRLSETEFVSFVVGTAAVFRVWIAESEAKSSASGVGWESLRIE